MTPRAPVFPVSVAPGLNRLNTVRALAIIGVFLFHAFTLVFHHSTRLLGASMETWPGFARKLALEGFEALLAAPQLIGVFFLMSGYTVHRVFRRWRFRNLDRNGRSFAWFFIWHRFWRLVPAFWVALLISYFLAYEHPFAGESLRKLAVNATLLKTLYPGYFFSVNYAHWYVAVQWQLDLLYPVFLFIVYRKSFAWAFGISCALALIFNLIVPHLTSATYVSNLPFRWWADWTLGALVAEMHAHNRRTFRRPVLAALTLGGLFLIGQLLQWTPLLWVVPRIALTLLLEAVVLSKGAAAGWERWIAPIGVWSYSIYLLHLPVLEQGARLLRHWGIPLTDAGTWLAFCAGCFVVTAGIAWLSYRLIEETSVMFGTRWWARIAANRRGDNKARAPA